MPNIMDEKYRADRITEILGPENKARKQESFRRMEIYKERQRGFIIEKLKGEFSDRTVKEMRTITSVNLCKRIIDEEASIYKKEPKRTFNANRELNQLEAKQIENLYEFSMANVKYKKANKFYKLMDQGAIQVLPKNGIIDLRVMAPHHYDVIPSDVDPEIGEVYILSNFDKSDYLVPTDQSASWYLQKPYRDNVNQGIGDADDTKRTSMRFVWWSKEFNFITDGFGRMVSDPDDVFNQLNQLPFVDIAWLKDFEFWVRNGSGVADFSIDFGVLLSDTANINKLQGYAQAIILSEKAPVDMIIGPNSVLHLPLDPNKEIQPSFQFATPNPDMNASLQLLESYISLFLSSRGIDTKTISGKPTGQTFSSGVERLLSNLERFEATRDDFDVFKSTEMKVWDLMKSWSNLFQSVSSQNLQTKTMPLVDELRLAMIPPETKLNLVYKGPETVQTTDEKENSVIKLLESGLLSKTEAIMNLRDVDEKQAEQILEKIEADLVLQVKDEALNGVEGQIKN